MGREAVRERGSDGRARVLIVHPTAVTTDAPPMLTLELAHRRGSTRRERKRGRQRGQNLADIGAGHAKHVLLIVISINDLYPLLFPLERKCETPFRQSTWECKEAALTLNCTKVD